MILLKIPFSICSGVMIKGDEGLAWLSIQNVSITVILYRAAGILII